MTMENTKNFKRFLQDYSIRVANSLGPDQDQHFAGPDLGLNCLQRLSVDNKSYRAA